MEGRRLSRVVACALTVALSGQFAAAQVSPTTEGGYEVTRSRTVVPVPQGKVGRKTIDRQTRVGVTEDTDGHSSTFMMTLGGFMNRCPVPEGSAPVRFVVSGDFEYSVVAESVSPGVVSAERQHFEKRMTAHITVFVNDDLSVTEGEIDGQFSSDIDGIRSGPARLHRRFPIRAYGTPDFSALLEAVTVTGDIAAAALMWNASTTILAAQGAWREPNACAELEFDPPSETRAVGSGETVDVRVRYRTRDGQQPIPRGTWDAAVEQDGRVTERSGQVQPDGTFVVRYVGRTSSAPKPGDGASITAISAAGYARDTWKIRVLAKYEGTFTQKQQMTATSPAFAAYGASVSADYRTQGRLVWEPERDSARAPTFGDTASQFYVPTDGEITVRIEPAGTAGRSIAGSCAYQGSRTFDVKALPSAARKYLVLEVAADGRYRLMLGMNSSFLQVPVTMKCDVHAAPNVRGSDVINDAAIAIGRQEGRVDDDTIAGRTGAPIMMGGTSITGEWQFKRNPPSRP